MLETPNRQLIFDQIRSQKAYNFSISAEGDDAPSYYNYENADEAIDNLDQQLDALTNYSVVIRLCSRPFPQKAGKFAGMVDKSFRLFLKRKPSPGLSGTSSTDRDYLEKIKSLELQIEKMKFENQVAELRRTLEDHRTPTDTLIEGLTPHLPAILGKVFNVNTPAPAIAGTDDEAERADNKAKLMKAIDTLLLIDKDFPDHISMIAKLATEKPDTYFGLIPTLKTFVG